MNIFLHLLKFHLITVYFFIKLITRQKKQVVFLSRQYNDISLNYAGVIDLLEEEGITYKCVCKKVLSSIKDSVRTQGNYSNGQTFFKKILKNFKESLSYYFSLYSQMRLIAESKVVIVDGYNIVVSLLKHKKGTKVIQMWHALGAIKQFGYQSIGKKDGINSDMARILKMHNNYDYILSGSEGMNPFFAEAFNTDISHVLAIGTPTVDYMRKKNPEAKKKIFKRYPQMKKKTNVLYSPTFRNDKQDNTQSLIDVFDFEKCNLIITNHPKVDNNTLDSRVIYINRDEFSTFDIVKVVDYVITDYSALMIDAAIANKKILLYVYDYDKYSKDNGVNIEMLKDFPHISSKSAEEIVKIITDDRYDEEEYAEFKKLYTPNIKGSSTKKIVDLIKRCLTDEH